MQLFCKSEINSNIKRKIFLMKSESERAPELEQCWADIIHKEVVVISHLVGQPGHTF